jgi:hypothetical protein
MTESLTNDKPRSTPKTPSSTESSADGQDDSEASVAATEAAVDPSNFFPGWILKLGGLSTALEAIDVARRQKKLPSLNPTDYRFVLGRPGGIPFSFPVRVLYKPDSPKEKDLGTFRIGR